MFYIVDYPTRKLIANVCCSYNTNHEHTFYFSLGVVWFNDNVFPKNFPRICILHRKCIIAKISINHKNSKYFSAALSLPQKTGKFMYKKVLFANGLNIVFKSKVALSHINMVFPKNIPEEKCLFWEKWEFSTDNLSHTHTHKKMSWI